VRRIAILGALVALLAACGPPGPKKYSEAKSRACVAAQRVRVTAAPASDFVANTALGGSFHVRFPGKNAVTVSFGDTVDNATKLDNAYRQVAQKNVGIDDVLRTKGNAVMLWHAHPSDADLALIEDCLKT
jgi:hypothetical protein